MTAIPSKFSKTGITLATYVDQFCDHRADCTNTKCELRPTSEMVIEDRQTDVAYTDMRHCKKFKPTEGPSEGAEIKEVGVWK